MAKVANGEGIIRIISKFTYGGFGIETETLTSPIEVTKNGANVATTKNI